MHALMTVKDAAKMLALSPTTIRKLLSEKRLTPIRIGRSVRVRVSELHAFIAALG